jgi:molybdopterin converting factor subunit 1
VARAAPRSDTRISLAPGGGATPGAAVSYNGWVAVTVLLFASIAQRAGIRRLELPVIPGDTVASVRDRLIDCRPELREFVPTLLYALDEEYVRESAPVADGATLALIPPVSGG